MSGSRRRTRGDFQAGMIAALDGGRFDITLKELCSSLGVTTGSFYSHYPDMAELHREVTGLWLRDRAAALAEPAADEFRDPLVSLRMALAAAADGAARDATMRRWAAAVSASEFAWVESVPVVAAAVAELDRIIVDFLTRAVTDLGFTGREPADLANWLAAGMQVQARTRDREGLETILDVWARAVAFSAAGPAARKGTAAPEATRLYTTASQLPVGARQALQQMAQALHDARNTAGDSEDHDDEATAGQAL